MGTPTFDPTQPYTPVAPSTVNAQSVPTFDPTKPYTPVTASPQYNPEADASNYDAPTAGPVDRYAADPSQLTKPDTGGLGAILGQSGVVGSAIHGLGETVAPIIQAATQLAPQMVLPGSDPSTGFPIDYGYGPGVVPDAALKAVQNAVPAYESNYNASRPGLMDEHGHNTSPDIPSDIAQTLPWLMGAGELRAATAPLNKAEAITNFGKTLGKSMGVGALSGLDTPVDGFNPYTQDNSDYLLAKGKQLLLGAGFGAAGKLAGDVISPTVTKQMSLLFKNGVTPSSGQMATNSGNFLLQGLGSAEAHSSGMPIIGDNIRAAEDRAVFNLNKGVGEQSLKDAKLPPLDPNHTTGNQIADEVQTKLNNGYDELLPKMQFVNTSKPGVEAVPGTPDIPAKRKSINFPNGQPAVPATPGSPAIPPIIDPFMIDMAIIRNKAPTLGGTGEDQLNSIIQNSVTSKIDGNQSMSGEQVKSVLSDLRQKYKDYQASSDPNHKALGSAIEDVYDAVKGNMIRNSAPEDVQRLKELDTGYHKYAAVIRPGAAKAVNQEGTYTPVQMGLAIRADDGTTKKGATAAGKALMQDLHGAATSILTKRPDSGTSGRTVQGGLYTGLGTALGTGHFGVALAGLGAAAATKGAAALGYSRTGQAFAKSLMTGRQGDRAKLVANRVNGIIAGGAGSQLSGKPLSTDQQMQELMQQPQDQTQGNRDGGLIQHFADGGTPAQEPDYYTNDATALLQSTKSQSFFAPVHVAGQMPNYPAVKQAYDYPMSGSSDTKSVVNGTSMNANNSAGNLENVARLANQVGVKSNPEAADVMRQAYTATRNNAIAALGFNPRRTAIDMSKNDTNLAGFYSPKQDTVYAKGLTNPESITHESIHRGINMLDQAGLLTPEESKFMDNGNNQEMAVRYIMATKMGDPDNHNNNGDNELGQEQRSASLYRFLNAYHTDDRKMLDNIELKAARMLGLQQLQDANKTPMNVDGQMQNLLGVAQTGTAQ
jgi:hypothetical protein